MLGVSKDKRKATDLWLGYTKAFTPQEAKKLFKGFIPSKPLDIGYIYIVDEGTLPEKSFFPELLRHNYASTSRKVTVSYEPKEKHHPRKDYDKTTKTWTERKGDTGLIEELIQQKGDFFCVANPNNARIPTGKQLRINWIIWRKCF